MKKTRVLTPEIEAQAAIVRVVPNPKDHGLKNIAARMAEVTLKMYGWFSYTKTETGEKVLIKLAK